MEFKTTNKNVSSLNFIKLKAGESLLGVFRGDPYDFKMHWVDNHSVVCTGIPNCELCAKADKARFRFRLNFIVNENGSYVAKVFEQGWTTYENLKALHSDYNLENHIMKITRNGSGTDTTYLIMPKPNGALNEKQQAEIAAVQLSILTHEQQHETVDDISHDVNFMHSGDDIDDIGF